MDLCRVAYARVVTENEIGYDTNNYGEERKIGTGVIEIEYSNDDFYFGTIEVDSMGNSGYSFDEFSDHIDKFPDGIEEKIISDYKKILGRCHTYDDPKVWERVKKFISKNKIELKYYEDILLNEEKEAIEVEEFKKDYQRKLEKKKPRIMYD